MSTGSAVLMVEDDRLFREAVCDHLAAVGVRVDAVGTLVEARCHMGEQRYELLLLDDQLPDGSGMTLVDPELRHGVPALVITGHPALDRALVGLRQGIDDYLEKPVDLDALRTRVLDLLPGDDDARAPQDARSPAGRAMLDAVRRASGSRSPVLLTGETGTGKTFLARRIHEDAHPERPFVHINCAALPENLIEAELFGTEKGAFTGARAKAGLLEAAGQGTAFLDEIGELPVSLQAKLLQCLESSELRRVGGLAPRPLRARVIAATNVDLDAAIEDGRFRADLRYRLEVLRIAVPALRERREDIPSLARSLLETIPDATGVSFPDSELDALAGHDWPGNVRELRNVLARAVLYADDGTARPSRMLEPADATAADVDRSPSEAGAALERPTIPPMPLDALEREQILRTLERFDGHRKETAKALGIGAATLRRKLHSYRDQGFADRIARIDRSGAA